MHRKFIALILATALAVTGLSAAPARAGNDTTRVLTGLFGLALLGAAIHNSRDRHAVTRSYSPPTYSAPPRPVAPRPLPPQITRKDLPQQCLRNHKVKGGTRNLFGTRCLRKHYAFTGSLPWACQRGYSDGRRSRVGYGPKCLRQRGYRFAHN